MSTKLVTAYLTFTGVYHDMHRKRTLDTRGAKSIRVLANGAQSVRTTAILAVTAGGGRLPPFLIYKGAKSGRLRKQFSRGVDPFCSAAAYGVQPNAWADEDLTLEYVDKVRVGAVLLIPQVIKPHLSRNTGRSLLIWDTYAAHKTRAVLSKLEEIGCDVLFVPGGLTSVLQPLDLAVNKPFKDRLRTIYSSWAMNSASLAFGLKKPEKHLLSFWACEAWQGISESTIINGFIKAGLRV